jgi:anionic cell wall polymer biosynthesis LytR-Cps2A-Psr (LCP) family protein
MAAENTVHAVRDYLGLDRIDGYFEMSMDDIGQLNRAVGGVQVTVEDDMENADPALTKGKTLVLDDKQAAAFLRARMNVGAGTNAERMARQRQYMASFFEKVRTETMKDPGFGLALWDMLKSAAVTNMNGNDFSRIAQMLLKGTNKGMHTVTGTTVLGSLLQDGQEHEEFYTDPQALRKEMISLFSLIPIYNSE